MDDPTKMHLSTLNNVPIPVQWKITHGHWMPLFLSFFFWLFLHTFFGWGGGGGGSRNMICFQCGIWLKGMKGYFTPHSKSSISATIFYRAPTQIVFWNSLCFPCFFPVQPPIFPGPIYIISSFWIKKMEIFAANIAIWFTFRIREFTTWANKVPCVFRVWQNFKIPCVFPGREFFGPFSLFSLCSGYPASRPCHTPATCTPSPTHTYPFPWIQGSLDPLHRPQPLLPFP